jgi:hypothetical protein
MLEFILSRGFLADEESLAYALTNSMIRKSQLLLEYGADFSIDFFFELSPDSMRVCLKHCDLKKYFKIWNQAINDYKEDRQERWKTLLSLGPIIRFENYPLELAIESEIESIIYQTYAVYDEVTDDILELLDDYEKFWDIFKVTHCVICDQMKVAGPRCENSHVMCEDCFEQWSTAQKSNQRPITCHICRVRFTDSPLPENRIQAFITPEGTVLQPEEIMAERQQTFSNLVGLFSSDDDNED